MAAAGSRLHRHGSLAAAVIRYFGLAVAGLAFAIPATAAFASDGTPPAHPATITHGGVPGITLDHGSLQLVAPADTDDGPAVVLRSSVSHVSTPALPGTLETATSGYAMPVWTAGAVLVGADRFTTGSRAPPADR